MCIEYGLPDPADDHLLQLVCHGIHHQKGDQQRPKLAFYYQLSAHTEGTVKSFPLFSTRAANVVGIVHFCFYGFIRASEHTTLHWSDITLTAEKLSITPFRCGHTIHLHTTNSYTCPLCAFHLYSNLTTNKLPSFQCWTIYTINP